MTYDDDTEVDEPSGPDHYFYSSDGHLWVDMTAVRERGRIDAVPLGGGELALEPTTVRVDKRNPVLNLPLTQQTDGRLRDYYAGEEVPDGINDALTALATAKDEIRLAQDTINEALESE
jgi:hypothetical protein